MTKLLTIVAFFQLHWLAILGGAALVLKGLQGLVAVALAAWPNSKLLTEIKAALDTMANNLPTQDNRSAVRAKLPAVLAALLLFSVPAKAQVWSAGLSLPMLEFQGGATHPVEFAPGAGAMVSVGFLQRALFGQQWDLLDVSATAFGTALSTPGGTTAGQLQLGLEIGTFNNILAIGVATPLYGPDGIGVFQGSFKAFPLLTINLPIALAPYSPPTGIYQGASGLPRGGTLYVLSPKPLVNQ